MGTSTCLHKHTESSRMMRGAWKADGEYILELHTKREVRFTDKHGIFQVGCDGLDARYRVGVFLTVYILDISQIQMYLLRSCSVSVWRMKVVTREYVSSFLRTGLFLLSGIRKSCQQQVFLGLKENRSGEIKNPQGTRCGR